MDHHHLAPHFAGSHPPVLLLQPCSLRCCLSAIKAGVAFQKVPLKDQLDILVQVVVFVEQLFCFFACLTAEVARICDNPITLPASFGGAIACRIPRN
ncbi:hypothetical protein DY000_02062729 [Brassica cretica]|uniref:Uncharacterized protein n=1 Tax=Brassica cretica TaxID=69181 RepID=A0ABQ7AT67_BRACR|nr:hypothetical protein DY000_02062729 [Brassica cretica]